MCGPDTWQSLAEVLAGMGLARPETGAQGLRREARQPVWACQTDARHSALRAELNGLVPADGGREGGVSPTGTKALASLTGAEAGRARRTTGLIQTPNPEARVLEFVPRKGPPTEAGGQVFQGRDDERATNGCQCPAHQPGSARHALR